MDFLEKHFSSLFQYDYTRHMEDELDLISKGEKKWSELCDTTFSQIQELCNVLKKEKEAKTSIPIDAHHEYIIGKFGPVIKCTLDPATPTFLPVKKDLDLSILASGGYTLSDLQVVKKSDVLGMYQGHELMIKKGKFGLYVTWGDSKKSLSSFGNRPIENVKYEDVLSLLVQDEERKTVNQQQPTTNIQFNCVRKITDSIQIKNGPYGDYLFYKNRKMKNPMFYNLDGFAGGDYKTVHMDVLKKWIVDTYRIRI